VMVSVSSNEEKNDDEGDEDKDNEENPDEEGEDDPEENEGDEDNENDPADGEENPESENDPSQQLKDEAKQEVKDVAVKWGKRYAKKAVVSFLAATSEIWVPILVVVLMLLFIFFIAVMGPVAICNMPESGGGVAGYIARETAYASRLKGMISGGGDFCKGMKISGDPSSTGNSTTGSGTPSNSTEQENRAFLAEYGITVNKAAPATTLAGMQQLTLYEIVRVAQACDSWAKTNTAGDTNPPDNRCGVQVTGRRRS
jgi:hypothetical protein